MNQHIYYLKQTNKKLAFKKTSESSLASVKFLGSRFGVFFLWAIFGIFTESSKYIWPKHFDIHARIYILKFLRISQLILKRTALWLLVKEIYSFSKLIYIFQFNFLKWIFVNLINKRFNIRNSQWKEFHLLLFLWFGFKFVYLYYIYFLYLYYICVFIYIFIYNVCFKIYWYSSYRDMLQ